jgi:lipopolysaccharide export system protein LptA
MTVRKQPRMQNTGINRIPGSVGVPISYRLKTVAAAGVLLAVAGLGAWSQAMDTKPAAPKAQAKSESKKQTPWNIQFESWEHSESSGDNEFTKVVAVSDEGTTIRSDNWRLNEKSKTAVATGNLKMTDPEADATGKKADIDYAKGKRILVLTGDVEILVKPKKDKNQPAEPAPAPGPAPVSLQDGKATLKDQNESDEENSGSVRKHPATITCDKLEYEYAKSKKHATLTGNFKVVQKLSDHTRTLTAEHAEWFGLEDRILLHPPVHVEDTKGLESFDTKEPVTVFTKENDERIIAKAGTGIYKVQDEDEDENKAAKPDTDAKPQPPKKK